MLKLVPAHCCVCKDEDAIPVGTGEDFEYRTSSDTFHAMRCRGCGVVYLNPRPAQEEFARIYPPTYHAFNFSPSEFGLIYRIRRRLEAGRVRGWCESLPHNARILDVGCGDGFHLGILRDYGERGWTLEGIEIDERAARAARAAGLNVHQGKVEELNLPESSYDLVLLIMTIEHVEDPKRILSRIRSLLRPGGSLVVVTDNTDSLDHRLFGRRWWGGYHFPRHYYLFNRRSLEALAHSVGLEVAKLSTCMTPVNWVYSIHNMLVDRKAPGWVVNRFTLTSPVSLTLFTVWDRLLQMFGKGGILRAVLRKPR